MTVSNPGGSSTGSAGAISTLDSTYALRADCKTLIDGAIASTSGAAVLTSASAVFTTSDVGKTIVVNGAGAAGVPLLTTIASRQSATQVTLAVAAGTVVTAAEFVYGTDNFTGLQQAINDAITAHKALYIAPATEGYLYNGTLVVNSNLDITGTGVRDLFGPAASAGFNGLAFPILAPYLEGSVLICAALNADAMQLTAPSTANNLRGWGIRFAGKWNSTGHGINVLPPIISGSYRENGLFSSTWDSLKVYGHDGNHYAFRVFNPLYDTFESLRSYGGGHMELVQASTLCSCGNSVLTHPYGVVMTAGSAHGVRIWNSQNPGTSNLINYIVAIRPQMWVMAPNPVISGVTAPTSAQKNWVSSTTDSVGLISKITVIAPDFETTVSSVPDFKIPAGVWIGGGAAIISPGGSFQNFPVSGTIYTNNEGTSIAVGTQYDLTPIQASLSTALTTGAPITALPVDALTVAIPSGTTVVTVSGGKRQTWTTTSTSAVSATSIAVTSQTPNFAYPIGSIVGADARILINASGNSSMSGSYVVAEATVPAGAVGVWRVHLSYVMLRGQYMQTTETFAAKIRGSSLIGVATAV